MKKYLAVDSKAGWPHSKNVFYECVRCGDILDSNVTTNAHCSCWNIVFDREAARTAIENESLVKIFVEE